MEYLQQNGGEGLGDLVHNMIRMAFEDSNVLLSEGEVPAYSLEHHERYCALRTQLNCLRCPEPDDYLPVEERTWDEPDNIEDLFTGDRVFEEPLEFSTERRILDFYETHPQGTLFG